MTRPDLCLDFANTRYWRGQEAPTETLNAPADLAAWDKGAEPRLRPKEFDQAIALRETLYRLFDAQAQGKAAASRDLDALNQALAAGPCPHDAAARARRLRMGRRMRSPARRSRCWRRCCGRPATCWPGRGSTSVRRCANPECGWLFLDDSRAGKRRWCSMSSCGNRAKARRHYHRSKEE